MTWALLWRIIVTKSLRFAASDGKSIAYQKVIPSAQAKAVVVIGHGMNEHGSRYSHLAKALADVGLAVYVPDLRGHGDTDDGANRGYLADSNGFERVVEDLMELGDFAAKEQGGIPLYYFGHSFGSLLCLALSGIYGKYMDGVVLSGLPEKPAPFLALAGKLIVKMGKFFKGGHAPAGILRSMTFGSYAKTVKDRRTGSDWISRDSKVVDAYIADPKCNFVCSFGFYGDLMHGLEQVYSESFLDSIPTNLPIYLISGSEDPVAGMKAGFGTMSRTFRELGLVDFESKCYEGGRHESINELNKDEVLSDITDWFSRHIA